MSARDKKNSLLFTTQVSCYSESKLRLARHHCYAKKKRHFTKKPQRGLSHFDKPLCILFNFLWKSVAIEIMIIE